MGICKELQHEYETHSFSYGRLSELLVLHLAGAPREDSRDLLSDALRRVRRLAPELPVTLVGAHHSLVEASCRAEMIVLGGPGAMTSAVVEQAHCPVVVVAPGAGSTSELPIAVGYDGTAGAERALGFAAERAARQGVPLVVVRAYSAAAGGAEPHVLARRFPGVEVRYEPAEGPVAPVLADVSRGCGLVVVGSRGRGVPAGSVGHGLVGRTTSPLAIVH